ncbi:hypothetical protein NM688_g966 [Phlebia brevispora]|uniref:Uncharacterized protein n=1 Tax=Phlebia brevispora TaxID=194682 RepID=A0ACC1TD71_9APHY|nr:hypothetical protein NM688_g966 [Phlebia brevispora]
MQTPPFYPDTEHEPPSRTSRDSDEADDEGISDASDSTSSWSELASPDRSSFDGRFFLFIEIVAHFEIGLDEGDEYNEEEFLGILSLARQAREQYSATHAVQDLEDSIAYLRDALTVAPPDNVARADILHMLAYDLYLLSQEREGPSSEIVTESLNDSIRLHRQALKALPSPHTSKAIYMTRLAIALRARYLQTNNLRDLDECIVLHRRALSLRPTSHADRAQSLVNLANALWTRFEHTGDIHELDEAIQHDREALNLRPPGHPARAVVLNSLATDLTARYGRTKQLSDLNEALALQKEALRSGEDVSTITAQPPPRLIPFRSTN